jgi:hypothetical protein
MRLFPEGVSKKLSGGALAAAAGTGIMWLLSTRDLLTLSRALSSPAFFMSLAGSMAPVGMPPLAALLIDHISASFIFAFLFWLSLFSLSAGVWLRREWARRGAVWMLYLLSAAALMLLIFPWLVIPRPLVYGQIQLAPEFNAAVRTAAFFARMTAALAWGLCLWCALALDRGPLRLEFRSGEEKK